MHVKQTAYKACLAVWGHAFPEKFLKNITALRLNLEGFPILVFKITALVTGVGGEFPEYPPPPPLCMKPCCVNASAVAHFGCERCPSLLR